MGLKEFNADLAAAKNLSFHGVSDVQKGDTEGELTFTYSHDRLKQDISIQVLAQGTLCSLFLSYPSQGMVTVTLTSSKTLTFIPNIPAS